MRHLTTPSKGRLLVAAAALLACWSLTGWSDATAQDVPRKLEREIFLMEEIISDVLIDSPYWLVSSGGPNHGIYIDGFGVLFSLEASLTSGSFWHDDGGWSLLRKLGWRRHSDRIIIDLDDDDEYWDDEDYDDEDEDAYDRYRSRRKERDERCYERGRGELREVLADTGDILSELNDQDYVAIAAFLEDHRYFRRNKLSRLFMKVKMGDLRAYHDDHISLEELESRIVVEEY